MSKLRASAVKKLRKARLAPSDTKKSVAYTLIRKERELVAKPARSREFSRWRWMLLRWISKLREACCLGKPCMAALSSCSTAQLAVLPGKIIKGQQEHTWEAISKLVIG